MEKPPYDIEIGILDDSRRLVRMVVETLNIDYDDGDNRKFELKWDKKFDISYKGSYLFLKENIPAIIERNKSCTVRLKGFFVDSAGNKIHFNTEHYFKYEPRHWKIYPLLSGV